MKNPQAFPGIQRNNALSMTDQGISVYDGTEGMTLRDYFAAKAMQALLSNESRVQEIVAGLPLKGKEMFEEQLAIDSLRIADAMLKAREQ